MLLAVLLACAAPLARALDWDSIPESVRELQRNLTFDINARSALFWGHSEGVVGGTGSTKGPLVYLDCFDATCFPTDTPTTFVAVLEEGKLGEFLPLLAAMESLEGSNLAHVPSAVIALPADDAAAPFSTAPPRPHREFYSSQPPAWNPGGLDLLSLTFPCPLFLAEREQVAELRAKAQANVVQNPLRMADRVLYRAHVKLESRMTEASTSFTCLEAAECVPLGGYSVWASMPPLQAGSQRRQIVVLTHWDAAGLFRSAVQAAHSGYAGLISMLTAADLLSAELRGPAPPTLSHDIVFVSLTAESAGLTGSRRLLFELERGGNSTAGIALGRVDAVVEVGMTAAPPEGGVSGLFVHSSAAESAAAAALQAAARPVQNARPALQVSLATAQALPPSSLLLWTKRLPDVDAVYLGDFDTAFANPYFWSFKDSGTARFSNATVARAGLVLARALLQLAGNTTLAHTAQHEERAQATAEELSGCLLQPGGLACKLVADMTPAVGDTAEYRVPVLREASPDAQDLDSAGGVVTKRNVERVAWEFLANRTFTGEPRLVSVDGEDVGCDTTNKCTGAGEVCLHITPNVKDKPGKCVRATTRYVPSFSTRFDWVACTEPGCTPAFKVTSDPAAAAFERKYGLPPDPMWTETYNQDPQARVLQQAPSSADHAVLTAGLLATAASVGTVVVVQLLYRKHKPAGYR